uniref:Uncharacterized protein n=1 Tax=viral metagenome TaxID=1070528 RepID=A0A6M3LNS2_9ZZZZ
MSAYRQVFEEAVKLVGFRKVLAELLLAAKIIDPSTVGQFTAHINSGGVTDAYVNKKI